MRFWLLLLSVVAFVLGSVGYVTAAMPGWSLARAEKTWPRPIRAGDIVFQDLDCGPRCELIRGVTKSKYTHVGMVLDEGGELVVWEAFGPVGPTPLATWARRGLGEKIAVYELRPQHLAQLPAIASHVRALRGLPYDADYQWDDLTIYCSELIAKAVNRGTARAIIIPRPVGELHESEALVANMTHGRLTPRTLVVSPYDLIKSGAFLRVVDELYSPELAALTIAGPSGMVEGCAAAASSCFSPRRRPSLLLP